ncbi:MAG TPA: division/cell wall cluster transcriptional repressor MraZ [Blastocatellia bacterium]|jgi:MraZ protein|nr:division/cell wall cluster transcriptional repressor MraZ [Blastocatellia bacterium]
MLRGNYTVRMDEKGRIKLPAAYRRYVDEHYGADFYVTSLTGECARLYPMREWLAIEEKLQARGTMDAAVRKFLDRTSFYGQPSEMDAQGRLLIHPLLRTSAELTGDVAVIGYLQYLEVWELDKFKARLDAEPYTAADAAALAQMGV